MGQRQNQLTLDEWCRLRGMMEMEFPKTEIVRRQHRNRTIDIFPRVQDRQPTSPFAPCDLDQYLVAVLGDIDCYENSVGWERMASGRGRSPYRCGSQ
uniref:hypothetical protein n=1 Tax=Psychromarinibacter sediminicola TaxID=3033385 RepID=UPI0035ABD6D8